MAKKRKAPYTQSLAHHIPPNIVESILARLPVKSILRFRSVCKLWNQIISHPHFSNLHSQVAATSSSFPSHFLIWGMPSIATPSNSFCSLNFSQEGFQFDADLGTPFGYGHILCHCDGLVLLRCTPDKYVLWNPYTRMHKTITSMSDEAAVGICHDPTTDDYKVVIINTWRKRYSVFSCKQRVWTKRKEKLEYNGEIIEEGGVHVDGAYYWLAIHPQGENKPSIYLLCFNGIEDKCEMLQLPLLNVITYEIALLNLKGCLGLVYRDIFQCQHIHIMSMDKNDDGNSWRHQRTIKINSNDSEDLDDYEDLDLQERPPCPISDRLVVIFLDSSKFIVYDVCEERVVQGPLTFPERWEKMLVPYHQHLFLSF